ncbi:heavy metal translocating P-type ATPase [Lentzea flaviverrucosa]|uniref:Cd2+/Zn2+-exporting ATPase n=1 Tax=Lentzea flaviverrucosa TaxID=200379 RepID=A0A1H9ER60_9PSEU|nr:cation-translocating P-type ATPase [Lentzea flaviverrucosa]RDI35431.1 Cd2+/Zn2+-exporting ATPase [Lentzea flaviverrucosa]SEQ27488.1 Cd2+/Zn2+-exporting ATPase [Lentzea flaviverrucosa]
MTADQCATNAPPPTSGLFGEADLSQQRLFHRNLGFLAATFACMAAGAAIILFVDTAPWPQIGNVISWIGLVLGYPMFWLAARTLFSRRPRLTTEVFITLALIAVVYEQEYWYASWVVFIMWLGETLMAWAGRHARSAVEALLSLVPRQARLVTADGSVMVPVEQIRIGQTVAVHPGERLPVDGIVTRGDTAVDESMLTGESVPADRGVDDEVFAGTYNLQAAIQVRSTTTTDQNTVARIVEMMRQAQQQHVPAQRTVDLFLKWFLPLVLLIAAAVGIMTGSLERVATILLVITPCAFSASTPLALIAAVGNAARRGIVIKGGASMEACSRATTVLLDKTGTLTASTPELVGIDAFAGRTEDEVLRLAAIAETPSSHPLARAVCAAATAKGLDLSEPEYFEVAGGHGVLAVVEGRQVAIGNERFLALRGLTPPEHVRQAAERREDAGHTLAYLVEGDTVIGMFGFLAQPRESAPAVIAGLRKLGVRHLVMVTGDRSKPAEAVARRLGIEYLAQATPQAKLDEVQRHQRDGQVVAMVGDGINDATALAAADVGIAMVSAGAEVSAMAADIVVHGDHLGRVLTAARLARRGIRTIKINILFATGYNVVGLILALAGLISPGTAALFHAASFISVVVNSALVLAYNPKVPDEPSSPRCLDADDNAPAPSAA